MTSTCAICALNITKERFPGIKCGGSCGKLFHTKCASISDGLLAGIKNRSTNWLCEVCREDSAHSIIEEDYSDVPPTVSLPEIMKQLKIIEAKLSTLNVLQKSLSELERSQQFISSSFDEFKEKVCALSQENLILKKRISKLEHHLEDYSEKMGWLESKVDVPEQLGRSRNIVISGLPINSTSTENLIINTIHAVGEPILKEDITNVHQIKQKISDKSILKNAFIVSLKSSQLQTQILAKFRKKKSLQLEEIDKSLGKGRVYMLQHLTNNQSKLYAEAKKIKNKFNFRFLWCSNNNILLRKLPGSEIHRIRSSCDINRLHRILEDSADVMGAASPSLDSDELLDGNDTN